MFYLILFLPLCVPFIAKYMFHREYMVPELVANAVVAVLVTGAVYAAGTNLGYRDTEIISGYVTSKSKEWTSCEHSYDCRCRNVTSCSGSGKSRSCSTSRVCDTCYEHSNDWDWAVKSTVGNFYIERIDRRGSNEPPRYSKVVIGEPAVNTHGYENFIKAAPDSLFYHDEKLVTFYEKKIPNYPEPFDYYNINRVINQTSANVANWNGIMAEALKTMGAAKQLNMVAVLTNEPLNFSDALIYSWKGGKKNDVIMVYGLKGNQVEWFQSYSMGNGIGNQELHITLRTEAIGKEISDALLVSQIKTINEKFKRVPMEQFEYLKDQVEPPAWVIILSLVLGLGSSLGLAYFFTRN